MQINVIIDSEKINCSSATFYLALLLEILTFLSIPVIRIYHLDCYAMILLKCIYINPSFFFLPL